MNVWDVEEAMKWADTWGPTDGVLPTGDQLALATLARVVRAAGAELAEMRRCFEAADRERSELRERAERARQAALIEAAELCEQIADKHLSSGRYVSVVADHAVRAGGQVDGAEECSAMLRAKAKEKGND